MTPNPFRADRQMNPFLSHADLMMGGVRTLVETLFDRTTGTNIGDATSGGGLAAAFDGDNDELNNDCAYRNAAANMWVGKTLTAAFPISKVNTWGSSDAGYEGVGANITISLYGKSGAAPANGTDGTLLGTTGSTSAPENSDPRTITSSDTTTAYDHVWVYLEGTTNQFIAELEIYVMA